MNNDPYDDLPLGMIDEEFFEEIALKQREPTVEEMRDMSAYFDSESFQYTENSFCDTINIGKQKKEDIR